MREHRRRATLGAMEPQAEQQHTAAQAEGEQIPTETWKGTPVRPLGPEGYVKGVMPAHLVKHAWRPGQSGGGHEHKRPSYRDLMRRVLRELGPDLPAGEEELIIAKAHVAMIIQDRNVSALKEWLDREHGPVVQRVEQNLNVQDVTRAEFDAFMLPPRVVEAEPVGQIEGPDQE